MQVSEGLPQAHAEHEQNAQRIDGRLHVVAEKFRIAEDVSGAHVVIGVPAAENEDREQASETQHPSEAWTGRLCDLRVGESVGFTLNLQSQPWRNNLPRQQSDGRKQDR